MYQDLIESNVKVYNLRAISAQRYYRIDCPFCIEILGSEDSHGHMHLFVDSWVGHCFRCNSRKHVKEILIKLGLQVPVETLDTVDINSKIKNFTTHPDIILEEPKEIEWPECAIPINDRMSTKLFPSLFNFLLKWGITPQTAEEMKWRWDYKNNNFIFPCFMNNVLVYYSTRGLDGSRYSCVGEYSKMGILGNFDDPLQSVNDKVYLVEGAKDAAMFHQCGLWALSLQGHHLSPYQTIRLNQLKHQKLICLDSDVTREASEMSKETGWEAVYLPEGDPADCGDALKSLVSQNLVGIGSRVRQLLKNKQVSKI
jgi:hypothetical protein